MPLSVALRRLPLLLEDPAPHRQGLLVAGGLLHLPGAFRGHLDGEPDAMGALSGVGSGLLALSSHEELSARGPEVFPVVDRQGSLGAGTRGGGVPRHALLAPIIARSSGDRDHESFYIVHTSGCGEDLPDGPFAACEADRHSVSRIPDPPVGTVLAVPGVSPMTEYVLTVALED